MLRSLISAAALVLWLVPAAVAQPTAASSPAASQPPRPTGAPAWKQIYENSQLVYYIDARDVAPRGASNVTSLLEYKIPQVVNGAQVWSIVSHMQLKCDSNQVITVDNTLFASKMGSGPVVEAQPASDAWHRPQPGSLGGLIWNSACGKP